MSGGYVERSCAPSLADVAACTWAAVSPGVGFTADPIIPDGCTDIVWDGTRLFVAGPDTTSWVSTGPSIWGAVGVRLRPGRALAVFGVPATGLVNQRPDLNALWGSVARWEDQLAAAPSVGGAAAVLERLLHARLSSCGDLDQTVDAAIASLRNHSGSGLVKALSDELGVGERQLLRRFRSTVGYGPKFLHRVLRLQCFLELLAADPNRDLAATAARAGYADQAHLSRDTTQLAGRPPGQLRERARRVRPVHDWAFFASFNTPRELGFPPTMTAASRRPVTESFKTTSGARQNITV
jgi:AraC-like DNA-binding protein